jgi:hypothetical protein
MTGGSEKRVTVCCAGWYGFGVGGGFVRKLMERLEEERREGRERNSSRAQGKQPQASTLTNYWIYPK